MAKHPGTKRVLVETAAAQSAPSRISAAREAAYRILLEVEKGQAHSDDLLRARFVNKLAPVDRNLATALVLGTLRWQIQIDQGLKQFLAKPNAKLDAEIRVALRLGALQLTRMERIPAHAAIAESVELAKRAGHSFAARMVNAVLRKVAAQEPVRVDQKLAGAAELALRYAHPEWMVARWVQHYGLEQAEALCAHGQQQPVLHLRLDDFAAEDELLLDDVELATTTILNDARRVVSGDVLRSATFRAGRVRIQDEGSQLVAELAAACAPQSVQKVCDACAAPGGKTLVLAEQLPKANILACEVSAARVEELAKRLQPLGKRVECRTMDAATLQADEGFDLILVDAPCSGTGTMGRNPEIRHRLKPEELARQAERQRGILSAALAAVRVGGRVVYSTCSVEREENDEVVASVLGGSSSVKQISLEAAIRELKEREMLENGAAAMLHAACTPEGALRMLPGRIPTDGFFVAAFERVT